ncbi:C6 zinc finger domain protein [Colletotrichum karsti]|uniref:C6 zinc finger domain protein n=1 Tax=Colletotrichum karsti TaxID=1095194 RepID=A0A9P6I2L5_9PEZI|nr:C6 zinc finger domain protein [Colletotrichum karsti]KAF9875313.1 C6 zinc finger domain protein [Colletotrichum karsti]
MPRSGTQKVKTGCITCKVRRIKCDERRPACARCVTTGRKCDGYAAPAKASYSWEELLRERSPTDDELAPLNNISLVERRSMSFFQRVAAPGLAGPLNKYFWATVVPQVANQEPVARHAVLAVSSLYEDFVKRYQKGDTKELEKERNAFAVKHYNEAIRLLRTTADRALVLFVCVLFICVELLRKNPKDAVEHCRHGINILNEVKNASEFLRSHIQPALRHLSIVPYLYGADPSSFPALGKSLYTGKYHVKTLSECHAQLTIVLIRVVRFTRDVKEGRLEPGYEGPEPTPDWSRQDIIDDLESWMEGFRHFKAYLYVPVNADERNTLRLLEMRWLVSRIMIETCEPENEFVYDKHTDKFRAIVNLAIPAAAEITKASMKTKATNIAGKSALELGFTSLLAYVVMKCRVFDLRLAAWKLMHRLFCPGDNIWSEDVTLILGKRIIEIEHELTLNAETIGIQEEFQLETDYIVQVTTKDSVGGGTDIVVVERTLSIGYPGRRMACSYYGNM